MKWMRCSRISPTITTIGATTLITQKTAMRVVTPGAIASSGLLAIAATVMGRSTFSDWRKLSTQVTSAPIALATATMNASLCETVRLTAVNSTPPMTHRPRLTSDSVTGRRSARLRAMSLSSRVRRRCHTSTGSDTLILSAPPTIIAKRR